jgi:type VI secretion system secreted protein Hcp
MRNITLVGVLVAGVLFAGSLTLGEAYGAVFAKYDGIDGESTDAEHDKWIDVLSIDWGTHKKSAKKNKPAKNVIDDFTITMAYEKASPQILRASLEGSVIPLLQIEVTAEYGGARATYLKYELVNVLVTSYGVSGLGGDIDVRPTVVISNNFEEFKVTYTEYDDRTGAAKGNAETTWKVEKGEK